MKVNDDLISAQLDCSSYPPELPSAHYIIKPQKLVENAKRQKSSPAANFCAVLLCFLVRPDSARVGGWLSGGTKMEPPEPSVLPPFRCSFSGSLSAIADKTSRMSAASTNW